MTITAEATVENGQLKLKDAIALPQGTAVRVSITPVDEAEDPFADIIGACHTGRTDGAEHHDKYLYGQRP
ncbi:MAG: antitoxin family protein [Planctomycetaceae bacterium]